MASYFKFIKWTGALNVISLLIVVSLIIVPQSVEDANPTIVLGSTNGSCDIIDSRWVQEAVEADCCTELYDEIKAADAPFPGNESFWIELGDFLIILFQGDRNNRHNSTHMLRR